MKKILILFLLPLFMMAQSPDATPIENIVLLNAVKDNLATRVMVQDSITKELKWVLKSSLGAKTNISIGNKNANTFDIVSSNGTGATAPSVTITEAGLMTASDKVALNGKFDKSGGQVSDNIIISTGFGKGLVLEDGFNIFREEGYTGVRYGGVEKINISEGGASFLNPVTAVNAISSNHLITKGQVETAVNLKVDKVTGKSLIADSEITRLSTVTNQVVPPTNISISNKNANTFDIVSSNGTGATAPSVTITEAGLMTASDKVALDGKFDKTGGTITGDVNFETSSQSSIIFKSNGVNSFNLANNVSNEELFFYNYFTNSKSLILNKDGSAKFSGTVTSSNATLSTQVPTWGQTTASPALTGTPTAPTATLGTNTTQLATTAFVLANGLNIPHLEFNNTDKTVWNNGKGNISTNTSFGINSLYSNTTGAGNTANGANSLQANTTGGVNTANGIYTLFSNTTGGGNTANGSSSLYSNTTGGNNTANGSSALYSNTTGGNNTANGSGAGRFIADGSTPNTITNNSIYLGANTKALADNQTNQTVIGYDTTGKGSNTVTIGNTSVTNNYFSGTLNVSNLAVYADNTTATAGGLAVGTMYRTSLGIVMIVY